MKEAARKGAALIMAAFGGTIGAWLTGMGIDPETATAAVGAIELIITVMLMLIGFFGTDIILGRIKRFFPDKWAEKEWADYAGSMVQTMDEEEARTKIRTGRI